MANREVAQWVVQGARYARDLKSEDAIRCYKLAIEIEPDHLQANFGLGSEYLYNRDFPTALKYLGIALQKDPSHSLTLNAIGSLYRHQHKPEQALEYYSRVIDPKNTKSFLGRGDCYLEMGDLTNAEKMFKKVIEIISEKYTTNGLESLYIAEALAWNGLGLVNFKVLKLMDAKLCFETAIQKNPKFKEAAENKKTVQMAMTDPIILRRIMGERNSVQLLIDPASENDPPPRDFSRTVNTDLKSQPNFKPTSLTPPPIRKEAPTLPKKPLKLQAQKKGPVPSMFPVSHSSASPDIPTPPEKAILSSSLPNQNVASPFLLHQNAASSSPNQKISSPFLNQKISSPSPNQKISSPSPNTKGTSSHPRAIAPTITNSSFTIPSIVQSPKDEITRLPATTYREFDPNATNITNPQKPTYSNHLQNNDSPSSPIIHGHLKPAVGQLNKGGVPVLKNSSPQASPVLSHFSPNQNIPVSLKAQLSPREIEDYKNRARKKYEESEAKSKETRTLKALSLDYETPLVDLPPRITPTEKAQKISTVKDVRMKVLTEIFLTEEEYNLDLKVMVKFFKEPLEKHKILTKEEIGLTFPDMELMLDLSTKLLEGLRAGINSGGIGIGALFFRFAEYFKIYTNFCSNQSEGRLIIKKLVTRPEFEPYEDVFKYIPQCKSETLPSLIIKPVQMICRYPLLLKELKSKTPESHTEYHPLAIALIKIEDVVNAVNEKKRSIESHQKVLELSKQLTVPFKDSFLSKKQITGVDLIKHNRVLIDQGEIGKWSNHTHSFKKADYYLFNDIILLVKSGTHKLKAWGPLINCTCSTIEKIKSCPEWYPFEMSGIDFFPKKSYRFAFPSVESRDDFLIKVTVEIYKATERNNLAEASEK